MQYNNPFELILEKLEKFQTTVNIMSVNTAIRKKQPEVPDPNRIINLPEAAKILCKPVATVRSYIHSRGLPAKLVGKSYLIKYSQLMEWFESFSVDAPTEIVGRYTAQMNSLRTKYRK